MGYAETFMYLFMHKLGATSTLIGLTVTVGACFEVLLQLMSTPITEFLNYVHVIAIGLLLFGVRFIGEFSRCETNEASGDRPGRLRHSFVISRMAQVPRMTLILLGINGFKILVIAKAYKYSSIITLIWKSL